MQYLFPLLAVFIWAGNTVVNKLAVGASSPPRSVSSAGCWSAWR